MSDMYLNPGTGRSRLDGTAAERVAVASMMQADYAVDEVRAVLGPDDFGHHVHRLLFDTCCRLRDAGRQPDVVAVRLTLIDRGQLADLGPNPDGFLVELLEGVPTAVNAGLAAGQVREAALYRRLRHLATELLRDAADGVRPADQLAAEFEARVAQAAAGRDTDGPRSVGDLLPELLADIDQAQSLSKMDEF